jgi:hypothetical protein
MVTEDAILRRPSLPALLALAAPDLVLTRAPDPLVDAVLIGLEHAVGERLNRRWDLV